MGNIRAASALRNNYRWKYIDCIRSRAFYWFKIYYFIAVEEKSQTIAYYKVHLNYFIQHIEIKGETFVKYTHDIQSKNQFKLYVIIVIIPGHTNLHIPIVEH